MRHFIINSINEIIRQHKTLKQLNPYIIFISNNKYNYEPNLWLHIDDVESGKGFINKFQVEYIKSIIPEIKKYNYIIVACDAGLSRSPSIASAIAYLMDDKKISRRIRWKYKHFNKAIFNEIVE